MSRGTHTGSFVLWISIQQNSFLFTRPWATGAGRKRYSQSLKDLLALLALAWAYHHINSFIGALVQPDVICNGDYDFLAGCYVRSEIIENKFPAT